MKHLYAVPEWIMSEAKKDFISFFEVMAILGIENRWVRMTANDQRNLFGANLFGKKQFWVDSCGDVFVAWSVSFGTDKEVVLVNRDCLQTAINGKSKLVF